MTGSWAIFAVAAAGIAAAGGHVPAPAPPQWTAGEIAAVAAAIFTGVQTVAVIVTYTLMRVTARRQLRAYLVVEDVRLQRPEAGKPIEVVVRLSNVGQTPAYNVFYQIGVTLLAHPTVALPLTAKRPAASEQCPHRYSLSKEFEIVKSTLTPASADDLSAITSGIHRRLYVHGTVFYQDVFGKPYETGFCVTLHGPFEKQTVEYFRAGNSAN